MSRILRRHQVPRLVECYPLTGQIIRASKTTAFRYKRGRPGELVHMEVKKIGSAARHPPATTGRRCAAGR